MFYFVLKDFETNLDVEIIKTTKPDVKSHNVIVDMLQEKAKDYGIANGQIWMFDSDVGVAHIANRYELTND